MNPESIFNERSPIKKTPHVAYIHLYEMSRKGKSTETQSTLESFGDWGEGLSGTDCVKAFVFGVI
jgi:hypothetical protein